MTWRWTSKFPALFLAVVYIVIWSCTPKKPYADFTRHPSGFYYKLLAFSEESKRQNSGYVAIVQAQFKTQSDSVFWDSSKDFFNRFYIKIKDNPESDLLMHYLKEANVGDSCCLLIEKKIFFNSRFFSKDAPAFTSNDSMVKVYLKVNSLFRVSSVDSLEAFWSKEEKRLVDDYLISAKTQGYWRDSLEVVWLLGKPDYANLNNLKNKTISLNYKGFLLNGKQFDESPERWTVNTSTPDQLLRGLNYVIKFMKAGESTKIILPSYLAFGQYGVGSIIPPYTPLLYEITVNEIISEHEP